MKDGDGVDGQCKDVGDCLGVDELQWLVVGCLDGGENPVQECGDGQALGRDNFESVDALVFLLLARQFVEKVAPQGVEVHEFLSLGNNRRNDVVLAVDEEHTLCGKG